MRNGNDTPGWFSMTAPAVATRPSRILYGVLGGSNPSGRCLQTTSGGSPEGACGTGSSRKIQYPTVTAYKDFLVNVMIPHWTFLSAT